MSTPFTEEGLKQFDSEPSYVAIARAWIEPGINPAWHYHVQQTVRSIMPVLGRALDRFAAEYIAWQEHNDRMAKMYFRLDQTNPITIPEEFKPKAGEQ